MNINRLTVSLSTLLATLLTLCSAGAFAADAQPQPPGIVEAFTCNYNDGKDRDDLLAARDYMLKQSAKAGLSPEPSFLWHRFKGSVTADIVWLTIHERLEAFGASVDAAAAAPAMSGVNARYDAVGKCQANLATIRTVYQGEPSTAGTTAFIASNACNARGAMTPGDVLDLRGHINEVLGASDAFKKVSVYAIQPTTSAATSPDVYLFGVYENASAWAKATAEMAQSEAGQSLRRHFEKVLECSSSMWIGEQVVDGPQGS
jgi:hypothetical protein